MYKASSKRKEEEDDEGQEREESCIYELNAVESFRERKSIYNK